jgi:hypothetical protein
MIPQVKPLVPVMKIKLANLSDEAVEKIVSEIAEIASAINE